MKRILIIFLSICTCGVSLGGYKATHAPNGLGAIVYKGYYYIYDYRAARKPRSKSNWLRADWRKGSRKWTVKGRTYYAFTTRSWGGEYGAGFYNSYIRATPPISTLQGDLSIQKDLLHGENLLNGKSSNEVKITADFSRAGSLGKVKLDGK